MQLGRCNDRSRLHHTRIPGVTNDVSHTIVQIYAGIVTIVFVRQICASNNNLREWNSIDENGLIT